VVVVVEENKRKFSGKIEKNPEKSQSFGKNPEKSLAKNLHGPYKVSVGAGEENNEETSPLVVCPVATSLDTRSRRSGEVSCG